MTVRNTLAILLLLVGFTQYSCKKETLYNYEVEDVNVSRRDASKPNVKSTTEFISIAYSDVFGSTIPHDKLVKLQLAYSAFGDQKLIEQLVIRNFLQNTTNAIPSSQEMKGDVATFIQKSYVKFFGRNPNEYEAWYLKNMIDTDQSITPEIVYYGMMTSNEYRYY